MSKSTYAHTNFTAGEISPRAYGRFDLAKFTNAVKKLENFLVYQLGGAMFRPGTRFVAEVKNSAKGVRLIPFQFSTEQAYILELGDLYMRFYANDGQVIVGTPVEIATPYPEAVLFELHFAQNADTMYIVHNDYIPQKLQRTGATTFTLTPVNFVRGAFLDRNVDATSTITASADTGNTNLTATDDIFLAGHVGALWRVKDGVVKITGFTDTKHVAGTVQDEPDGSAGNLNTSGAPTSDWAEGAWSAVRGYPATVTFHEQRLYYGRTKAEPQTIYGSVIQAFDDFEAGANDEDAVIFEYATEQVNAVRWISSGAKAMQAGTSGGTFSTFGGSSGLPITATNVNAQRDTNYGVAAILPKRISSYLYYLQRNLFQLRELVYSFYADTQISNDMNLLADHILRDGGGAIDMALQQSPNDRIWVVRADGQLAVMTRNPEQDVVGWSRIIAGNDAIGAGLFESVAVIQQPEGDDEIWVVVQRNINGAMKRYVEFFTSESFDYAYEPVRLDCSLSYDVPKDITDVTQADPAVMTAIAHGFANGDQIKIDNIIGMTELNGHHYLIKNKTADTFELTDLDGNDIDATGFEDYISGGEVRKMVTAISGLNHLEGETVSVMIDGGIPSAQQTFVVTGGAITLLQKAAVVHVGLPYTGEIQLLKLSDGSSITGQTKKRRVYLSTIRVYKSLGLQIGQDADNLQTYFFGAPNDPLGEPPPLVTGDVEEIFESWWSKGAEIIIRQPQPLPLMILAIVLRSEVEER